MPLSLHARDPSDISIDLCCIPSRSLRRPRAHKFNLCQSQESMAQVLLEWIHPHLELDLHDCNGECFSQLDEDRLLINVNSVHFCADNVLHGLDNLSTHVCCRSPLPQLCEQKREHVQQREAQVDRSNKKQEWWSTRHLWRKQGRQNRNLQSHCYQLCKQIDSCTDSHLSTRLRILLDRSSRSPCTCSTNYVSSLPTLDIKSWSICRGGEWNLHSRAQLPPAIYDWFRLRFVSQTDHCRYNCEYSAFQSVHHESPFASTHQRESWTQ